MSLPKTFPASPDQVAKTSRFGEVLDRGVGAYEMTPRGGPEVVLVRQRLQGGDSWPMQINMPVQVPEGDR